MLREHILDRIAVLALTLNEPRVQNAELRRGHTRRGGGRAGGGARGGVCHLLKLLSALLAVPVRSEATGAGGDVESPVGLPRRLARGAGARFTVRTAGAGVDPPRESGVESDVGSRNAAGLIVSSAWRAYKFDAKYL